jgi:hypothetical protein
MAPRWMPWDSKIPIASPGRPVARCSQIRSLEDPMRTVIVALLAAALGVLPAQAHEPEANQGLEVGDAVAATYINLGYVPAKLVVATVGMVGGALAGFMTGGDTRAAYALWVPTVGGDWFVRPEHLEGERGLAFFGSDYDDTPSLRGGENDTTYGYQGLYSRGMSGTSGVLVETRELYN